MAANAKSSKDEIHRLLQSMSGSSVSVQGGSQLDGESDSGVSFLCEGVLLDKLIIKKIGFHWHSNYRTRLSAAPEGTNQPRDTQSDLRKTAAKSKKFVNPHAAGSIYISPTSNYNGRAFPDHHFSDRTTSKILLPKQD